LIYYITLYYILAILYCIVILQDGSEFNAFSVTFIDDGAQS